MLLIRCHIIPWELLDHQVHPLNLTIGLGAERSDHLEFRPHSLPWGSPKLVCELWVSIQDYVLWKAMMLENMCEEQPIATRFLGRGLILCGNEMCHLVKSIYHHHDGIETL